MCTGENSLVTGAMSRCSEMSGPEPIKHAYVWDLFVYMSKQWIESGKRRVTPRGTWGGRCEGVEQFINGDELESGQFQGPANGVLW